MQCVFSTFPFIPTSPSLSSGVVRPINHRASAYHLGAPIACQSSDKMDFQLSQGSQARSGRMENRQTSAAPLPLLTFCLLFVFLQLCSALVPLLLSSLPSSCLSDLLAGWLEHEKKKKKRLVVKGQIPVHNSGGSVMLPQQVSLVSEYFNSGWIFN